MRRAILFAILSLLLLGLQQQAYVHPLAHLAGRAVPAQGAVVSTPHATADCLECALLSGGFHTVHHAPAEVARVAPAVALPNAAPVARATAAPAWYSSRAPPISA
jgi:hypothetical protein